MNFYESSEYLYGSGIIIVFVQLFSLIKHTVFVISHCAYSSLVETGLYAGVIVLGEGGARLSVKEVPG